MMVKCMFQKTVYPVSYVHSMPRMHSPIQSPAIPVEVGAEVRVRMNDNRTNYAATVVSVESPPPDSFFI